MKTLTIVLTSIHLLILTPNLLTKNRQIEETEKTSEDFKLTALVPNQMEDEVKSCVELLEQISRSDCGSNIIKMFNGGNITLGASSYKLSLNLKDSLNAQVASFPGDSTAIPHYSISTKRNFWGRSGLGYDYSFTFGQAAAFTQQIKRGEQFVNVDLGTYAVGSLMAAQANLFYSIGGNDSTPYKYFTFSLGLGMGYASTRGKAYITNAIETTNPSCFNAGSALVDKTSSDLSSITQNCEYVEFNRSGVGVSGRILLDFRYRSLYGSVQISEVNLNAAARWASGHTDYNLSPGIIATTLAYIIDI